MWCRRSWGMTVCCGVRWRLRARCEFLLPFRHVGVCQDVYEETLSIRIDVETKKRLDVVSKRLKRSKSFLAAEAIAAYVESEEWQLGEIQAGIAALDSGREVGHEKVSKWLKSWGELGPGDTGALELIGND